jgi:drug/metabolite transporter (DMT)-like permease
MTEGQDSIARLAGLPERALGVTLISASAAVFALAGVLTKSITADSMTVACWRGLVGAILIGAYVIWRNKTGGRYESLALGRKGWALAFAGAAASAAFISSFKFSYVANVTIIYSTVPFAAAILGWLLMREKLRTRTLVASAVSLTGVAILISAGLRAEGFLGYGLAITMTLLSAVYIVMVRMFRDAPVIWASAVAAMMLFALGWLVTDPLAVTARDAVLLGAFGVSFAVACVLWTEGARLIPAAESALLGLVEVPCAVTFAWLFLGEVPPAASLIGGAIVLLAVFWHAARDLDQSRRDAARLN